MLNSVINQSIGNPFAVLDRNRQRNMVFYGRVSTEHEAQLSALENQIQWYDDQAKYHPNWTVMDKYIDEGITGTQAKKRPSFLRMLDDARAGKFDLIVTREVCRFARNTVDTLVTTRELKNIGVEVYFVEDNIWTMDGDGELRLTIMATLAQEESRKVSERVKAGQQISRQNGTLYGCGNILGYDLKRNFDKDGKWNPSENTYIINPEQAATVRMIFDMYLYDGLGTTAIANELTRLQRLNASGKNKWNAGVIARIINNQTYMGVMAYGKSYSNNYLEQKRVNNHDASTYMCAKLDFEPIVTEEEWYKCQEIKSNRVSKSLTSAVDSRKKQHTHGVRENKDLWGSKLLCSCGHSFRKNRWHKNKGKSWSYGYQCYNQLNNGSATMRRKAGADDTGYCDQPMIADWKLEMMAKMIFEEIWKERKESIDDVCKLIKECYQVEKPQKVNINGIVAQIERYKTKKANLFDMRTDGEISKEEFKEQREKIENAINELTKEYDEMLMVEETKQSPDICWDNIRTALNEVIDLSSPHIDRDIIKKFVSKIVPNGKNHFRWYMNLDGNETTSLDMITEGRKNNAVVRFDVGEVEPPLHIGEVINVSDLRKFIETALKNTQYHDKINKKTDVLKYKKSSHISIQHRQLLKMRKYK
ncbi:MAG: recombinase family protein [Clostridiales bacterium]|nr:recombinase family protein [Clostridiales bacterium]